MFSVTWPSEKAIRYLTFLSNAYRCYSQVIQLYKIFLVSLKLINRVSETVAKATTRQLVAAPRPDHTRMGFELVSDQIVLKKKATMLFKCTTEKLTKHDGAPMILRVLGTQSRSSGRCPHASQLDAPWLEAVVPLISTRLNITRELSLTAEYNKEPDEGTEAESILMTS